MSIRVSRALTAAAAVVAGSIVTEVPAAEATVIVQPLSIVSNSLGESLTAPASRLIDQSGLSPQYQSGITEFDPYVSEPVCGNNNTDVVGWGAQVFHPTGVMVFDLGVPFELTDFALWNGSAFYRQQVRTFQLRVDSDGDFSSGATFCGTFQAAAREAQGNIAYAEVFNFTPASGRYVEWSILSNDGNGFGTIANEVAFGAIPQTPRWNVDASGNWSAPGNWLGSVPGGAGSVATFSSAINLARTVNVDTPRTVGALFFNNAKRYTLSGVNTLTLDTTSGPAAITVYGGSHTISCPVLLSKDTTMNIIASASVLTISGTVTAAAGVTINKSGAGTVSVKSVRTAGLTVSGGAVNILPSGQMSIIGSLAVGNAKFDLLDKNLIVTGTPVGSWNGSAYTGVTGMVQSGRGTGNWNGFGLVTSMTDATTSDLTTLAIATADQANYVGETFGGRTMSSGEVIVMYTWGGDADLNGQLNGDDYFYIDSNIIAKVPGFHNGDFNYDGDVNGDDYFIIDSNILYAGLSEPFPAGAGASPGVAAVPEPASALVIAAGAFALQRRRRGRLPE